MNRIIYQNDEGGVTVLTPCPCGMTLEEIAQKDVPTGKPYKFIDASDLPATRMDRDAWVVDPATLTDGVGA